MKKTPTNTAGGRGSGGATESYFAYLNSWASVLVMLTLRAREMNTSLSHDIARRRSPNHSACLRGLEEVLLPHMAKPAQTNNGSQERQKQPEYCQV